MTQTVPADTTERVRIERRGAAAIVTLDRADALNALDIAARGRLRTAISGFGRDPSLYVVVLRSAVSKAFCVGGDVREMTGLAAHDPQAARRGLADELRLCWAVECLSKPTVSFVDGHVMGTGVGITLYNTHRVAGEGYRFAMPETQIGYFPDCGVAHAFARMPHGIGVYLGLTGHAIGAADALALRLVTHCIPRARFAEIEARLADAEPVDPELDTRHAVPGPSPLMAQGACIERYFGAGVGELPDIVARLQRAPAADRAFAEATLERLAVCSPIALAVTLRMIRNAARLDLRDTLIQDYRLAHRFAVLPDFARGVRAVLIEKTGKPSWSPERIEDVSAAMVDTYFAPLAAEELDLPTRTQMQDARA